MGKTKKVAGWAIGQAGEGILHLVVGGGAVSSLLTTIVGEIEHIPWTVRIQFIAAAFILGMLLVYVYVRLKRRFWPGDWIDPEKHAAIELDNERLIAEIRRAQENSRNIEVARQAFIEQSQRAASVRGKTGIASWMAGSQTLLNGVLKPEISAKFSPTSPTGDDPPSREDFIAFQSAVGSLRSIASNLTIDHLNNYPKQDSSNSTNPVDAISTPENAGHGEKLRKRDALALVSIGLIAGLLLIGFGMWLGRHQLKPKEQGGWFINLGPPPTNDR